MQRCDRHNEVELNLLEEGSLTYLLSGRRVTVPAGRLAVFWAGVPHRIISYNSKVDYYVMTIPLVWFLQWRLAASLVQTVLQGQMLIEPDAGPFAADQCRFRTWLEDIDAGTEDRRRVCLLEIEARLRRLALAVTEESLPTEIKPPKPLGEEQLSRAEQMACFVARNYTRPLTAEMIGHHVGLHPNYAMDVFQRAFGTTLMRYVTQHRLAHAQRLLVTTSELILDVALRSGFGSLSRFNEAFRKAFDCTPRDYRRQHRLS